jgi:hypothetical protein
MSDKECYLWEQAHAHIAESSLYVGETGRTIGSGIKEHLKIDEQTVYKHIKSHKSGRPDQSDITWKTLHKNV